MVRPLLLLVSCLLFACDPRLVVGERTTCAEDTSDAGASASAATDPVAIGWSTSFEDGFCDYTDLGGFCFGGGSHTVVSSRANLGQFAAEFSVSTTGSASNQARCVRQGVLPVEAYYGAWYFVPARATLDSTASLWNLLHFQGGDTSTEGLWDISLVNTADGNLELLVYDFLAGVVRRSSISTTIPIQEWFHIQFYLKRSADATGAIRLYQNRQLLIEATGIITDDSTWAQWYVGNIAKGLTPSDNTVYVDDVSIRATL